MLNDGVYTVIFKLILIASASLLTACSSNTTGPINIGQESIVLSHETTLFSSQPKTALESVLESATSYCLERERFLLVDSINESISLFASSHKATLVFSCKQKLTQHKIPASPQFSEPSSLIFPKTQTGKSYQF